MSDDADADSTTTTPTPPCPIDFSKIDALYFDHNEIDAKWRFYTNDQTTGTGTGMTTVDVPSYVNLDALLQTIESPLHKDEFIVLTQEPNESSYLCARKSAVRTIKFDENEVGVDFHCHCAMDIAVIHAHDRNCRRLARWLTWKNRNAAKRAEEKRMAAEAEAAEAAVAAAKKRKEEEGEDEDEEEEEPQPTRRSKRTKREG